MRPGETTASWMRIWRLSLRPPRHLLLIHGTSFLLRIILPPSDHHRLSEKLLMKNLSDRPSITELSKTRIHLGVKEGHYRRLLGRMEAAGMILYQDLS